MAKNSITDYSKTAASNTDIQSVDIDEGCLPSGINNAIRELMADLAAVNDGTVSLTSPSFAAASLTGNLSFGDNDKAIFGAGSDLQIYHDGTHGYLLESNATGNLYLGGDNLILTNANVTKVYLKGIDGGATELRHNNSTKLATTSTGIDVTGTVTADGLTVQGDAYFDTNNAGRALHITRYGTVESESANFTIDDNDLVVESIQDEQYGGYVFKATHNGVGTRNRLDIASNGDISFYEDTGTTAKLFWDASAERLGIGTSSPAAKLEVYGADDANNLIVGHNNTDFAVYTDSTIGEIRLKAEDGSGSNFSKYMTFYTQPSGSAAAERMRIDSSGNVGINQSALGGGAKLEVNGDIGINRIAGGYTFRETYGGGERAGIKSNASNELLFNIAGASEAMRIDSSGNVGIGTSSPTGAFFVAKQTDTSFSTAVGTSIGGSSSTGAVEIFGSTTGASLIDFSPNDGVTDFGGRIFYSHGSDYMSISTNGSERMRIDSSGNVLVGTTTVDGAGGVTIKPNFDDGCARVVFNRNNTTATSIALLFEDNGTGVGSIRFTNTATSYVTSSDYRLKENVTDITDGIERVKQLNPSRFNFIADADTTVDGFLAHEAATVVPEAVTGEKDAVDADGNPEYQGIDQAKLVPLLTAALKEAITKIEDLEARVATLEGN